MLCLKVCFSFLGFLLFCALPLRAAEHYVRPPGTCTNTDNEWPYTSWDTAATNIQWAVNAATADETVWVSNGIYCITNEIHVLDKVILQSVAGYSNTSVYAGWPTYTTRCFYVDSTGIVNGFTISNGHCYGSNNYSGGGGAFITNFGIIQNCYFVNNICSNAGYRAGGGGAFLSYYGLISNCWFVSNMSYMVSGSDYSGYGGGAYVFGGRGNNAVLGCTIISNWSTRYGGGLAALSTSSSYFNNFISNCLIAYNCSGGDGGAYISCGFMYNCIVSNNAVTNTRAVAGGGGVNIGVGIVRNCIIVDNKSGLSGAGINVGNRATVSDCIIAGNKVTGAQASGGGGVYLNSLQTGTTGIVERCWISNNICSYGGGGGVVISNTGTLRNCLIHNNTNLSPNYGGGGVLVAAAATNGYSFGVLNCTIVDNFSTNEGGGIATQWTNNYLIANCIITGNRSSSNNFPDVYNTFANSNIYYNCCANPSAPLAPNQGNITSDPRFIDAANSNWRLKGSSPCINAGANQDWMTNTYDLDGRIRIRYGTVDMGTYEGIFEGTVGKLW